MSVLRDTLVTLDSLWKCEKKRQQEKVRERRWEADNDWDSQKSPQILTDCLSVFVPRVTQSGPYSILSGSATVLTHRLVSPAFINYSRPWNRWQRIENTATVARCLARENLSRFPLLLLFSLIKHCWNVISCVISLRRVQWRVFSDVLPSLEVEAGGHGGLIHFMETPKLYLHVLPS